MQFAIQTESAYFELLATKGNNVPVDGNEEVLELKLPDWYDEAKVKRWENNGLKFLIQGKLHL